MNPIQLFLHFSLTFCVLQKKLISYKYCNMMTPLHVRVCPRPELGSGNKTFNTRYKFSYLQPTPCVFYFIVLVTAEWNLVPRALTSTRPDHNSTCPSAALDSISMHGRCLRLVWSNVDPKFSTLTLIIQQCRPPLSCFSSFCSVLSFSAPLHSI